MNDRQKNQYKLIEVRDPAIPWRTNLISVRVDPIKRINSPAMTKHKEEK